MDELEAVLSDMDRYKGDLESSALYKKIQDIELDLIVMDFPGICSREIEGCLLKILY